MRISKAAVFTILVLGMIPLGGCGDKEQKAETQKAEKTMTYDLSAGSNQKYLAENSAKDGVKTLPSGLQYRIIKSGAGSSPTSGMDMVTVTYKGWLIDGTVFDQTGPGQTAKFPAGRLIPGWVEALRMMKEGDEWELTIPSNLAYGSQGAGDVIPPDQTLVFQMALLKVDHQTPPQ
ncbi:MAG: hypothetical protein GC166_13115 [Alphaproteobacteria bacterium]|nr:hypothetical protein [Alphaproteobacteria bacterium]